MRVGAFNSNAPRGSIEVGVADDPIQIQASQNRNRHGNVLAALNATAGALANPEATPELGLGLVECETDVGDSLKFHLNSLPDTPVEITYQFC